MTRPGQAPQRVERSPVEYLILVIAAIGALVLSIGVLFWLAGQISGVLAGRGWPHSRPADMVSVLRHWPHTPEAPALGWPPAAQTHVGPAWLFYLTFLVLLTLFGALVRQLVRSGLDWRRRREGRLLRLGFASGSEIQQMLSASAVTAKAKSVRPSACGKHRIDPLDVGFYLGRDIRSRHRLYASVEDVFIILAPPRQGKDVHFCAPYTIDAPGACIVTSTRADAFTNTYQMRTKMGTVRVFDPNGLTNWPERLRWSPVLGAENPRIASSRAVAIINGAGLKVGQQGSYWISAAIMVLRIYLHAAALGRRAMRDVVRWSTQPANPEPIAILREAETAGEGARGWAAALESAAHSHPEHVGAVWATLVQGLTCFSDPDVLEACSPGPRDVFDVREFLTGRNTLYILGKEQASGGIAPVVTAMLEDMFDEVRKVASRMPGSRLDPPLTIELNEAAHIAPLPNLPGYMGDSGGFSIALHVYLQSLSQARSRWGEHEAMIMWDNAAIRVIMGGAGNVDDLDDVSRLMGEVRGPAGRSSGKAEGRPVLSAEEIRTLKFGTAVVVARAARPVEVELLPWWERKDAEEITAGKAETEKLILQYGEEADRKLLRPVQVPFAGHTSQYAPPGPQP